MQHYFATSVKACAQDPTVLFDVCVALASPQSWTLARTGLSVRSSVIDGKRGRSIYRRGFFFVFNISGVMISYDVRAAGGQPVSREHDAGLEQRIYDELFVAIHSLLYVGKTTRKIVVLAGGDDGNVGMPEHVQDRLRRTGCCELRRAEIRCLGYLGDCHIGGGVGRSFYEAFRMLEFEKIALVNSDIQIVSDNVDAIFRFPLDGFALAAATNGGRFDRCTKPDGELGPGGYVNSGVIMIRPSRELYRNAVKLHRCTDWTDANNEQLEVVDDQVLLNAIFTAIPVWNRNLDASFRSHCLPSVFNCMDQGLAMGGIGEPCASSEWPTVFLRHLAGDAKPLLMDPEMRERWRVFGRYLDAHDRATSWAA